MVHLLFGLPTCKYVFHELAGTMERAVRSQDTCPGSSHAHAVVNADSICLVRSSTMSSLDRSANNITNEEWIQTVCFLVDITRRADCWSWL